MTQELQYTMFFDQPYDPEAILDVFTQNGGWMSVRQVADALGRSSKSPKLYKALNSLYDLQCLDMQYVKMPNGVDMLAYRLSPNCERGFSTHSP